MSPRIHIDELERLLADDNTPDEVLAEYLQVDHTRSSPLAPSLTVDADSVEVPTNRGLFSLPVKVLNARTNRRRLAAYKQRIADGWTGPRILAEGDSWFLFPILLKDVVDNLNQDFAVYSLAAAGDTLANMAEGMDSIESLIAEHDFDAFLLSAGGNDLAGEHLKQYVKANASPARAPAAFIAPGIDAFISNVHTTYDRIFQRLTTRFPRLAILCHGYDWALPRIRGPWLGPPLMDRNIPIEMHAPVIRELIDRFYATLLDLAAKYPGRVHVVDCRGAIGSDPEWFDELHPLNAGYTRIADRFRATLNSAMSLRGGAPAAIEAVRLSWWPREDPSGARKRFKLLPVGSVVTIGRHADREIVLDDDRVSRNHARIEVKAGGVEVADLGSTNGTLLAGAPVKQSNWPAGRMLSIGIYDFGWERISAAQTELRPFDALLNPVPPPDAVATGRPPSAVAPARAEALGLMGTPAPLSSYAPGHAAMLRPLKIELVQGDMTGVEAPAYVVGIFDHLSPMASRGPALALDALTGGKLSSLVQAGLFGSQLGQVSLLPAQHLGLRAGHIAFLGLGSISRFAASTVEAAAENLARVLAASRIDGFATVPLGTNTNCSIRDFVPRFLQGLMRGLNEADPSAVLGKLALCELDKQRFDELAGEVSAQLDAGAFRASGFEVSLSRSVQETNVSRGHDAARPPLDIRFVHVNAQGDNLFEFFTLPSAGAGLPCFTQVIEGRRQEELAARAARIGTRFDATLGSELADLYIPAEIREALAASLADPAANLVVVHDTESALIPWEGLFFDGRCAALESGITRKCRVPSKRMAGGPLPAGAVMRMLVVYPDYSVDSGLQPLPGAEDEGRLLTGLFREMNGEATVLAGADATRQRILSELAGGVHTILHYAGHAYFDVVNRRQSGLLLDRGETITAAELIKLPNVPRLVFFNACESGRMRSVSPEQNASHPGATLDTNVSLAEALFAIGVGNFVGTYWQVDDLAAKEFARTFYLRLLQAEPLGLALRAARLAVKESGRAGERHWANYLHFGDPIDRLREPPQAASPATA